MKALANIYTSIISSRFPRIRCIPGPEESIVALGVTDAVRRALANFIIEKLGDEVRRRGYEFHGVMTLNPETSSVNYPEEWQAMQDELAAIDSTKIKQTLLKYALISPNPAESWITPVMSAPSHGKSKGTEVHPSVDTFRDHPNRIRHAGGRYSTVKLSDTPFVDDSELIGSAA